ncbi:MAG: HAMP domain-containing histidine kinase [Planctomycetes bacterium]|nr:HAMP domain-containing histidine kinase [Planctomycetota bacterium]
MKSTLRHLPAALLVLGPLAALAWLGSAELTRQTERAERVLAEQAESFVGDAERALRAAIAQRVDELDAHIVELEALAIDPPLEELSPARGARELRRRDPLILDLVLLDQNADLLFPRASPSIAAMLVSRGAGTPSALRRAQIQETLGDLDGARELLREYVAETLSRAREGSTSLASARLALGGLERRRHALDAASVQFLEAEAAAALAASPAGRMDPRLATTTLLAELADAEVGLALGRGGQPLLDIAEAIADGLHDHCADPLLEAVLTRIERALADDSELLRRSRLLRVRDDERRIGRGFAAEYPSILRETLRRRLQRAGEGGPVLQVVTGASGTSLLVLRHAKPDEFAGSALRELEATTWLGVRLDLDRLLASTVGEAVAGIGPFTLTVTDPDGTPLVPGALSGAREVRYAATSTSAGLALAAVPLDLDAALGERRDAIRARALLLILLSATAVLGAAFLVRSLRREAELARLKVDLVSRVTHDLKTPLALIRMYAETLERGRVRTPEEGARFAGIVAREADGLSRAVDRILDFSRSQAGTREFAPECTDLAALAEDTLEAWRPSAEQRELELRAELAEDVLVDVDPAACATALRDLLENAGKYARPRGPGVSRFVAVKVAREGRRAILEVADDGIGIPEGERERVFESFYRASNAGEARGTGLGLALVQHFVTAHGGKVVALGREGGGTIIRIELPSRDPRRESS